MTDILTPRQYRTLSFIATCPKGQTMLMPVYWRDRHHQALLRRGLLRLKADPFKTRASMLYGCITARGRRAVERATDAVKRRAKADEDREHAALPAGADE